MNIDRRLNDRRVRLYTDTGRVYIDGEELPFAIAEEGPTFEPFGRGTTLVNLPLLIFATELVIDGEAVNREPAPEFDRLMRETRQAEEAGT